jgi:hypothetical protein
MGIGNLTELVGGLERRVEAQESAIREACAGGDPLNVANATAPLMQIVQAAQQLRQSIEQTAKTLSSPRIPASLDRFERSYVYFLKAQNVRWLVLDVLLPIGVAVAALVFLVK